MTTTHPLTAARAEALFTSHLSAATRPSRRDVATAIRLAVRNHGGTRGCAVAVAGEYGDHPETAAARMRWALATVEEAYPHPADSHPRTLRHPRGAAPRPGRTGAPERDVA